VTRYPRDWQTLATPAIALTLTVAANTITVGGTPFSPLNAVVTVDGLDYLYPVQPGDTLTSIATGLAALINEDTATSSSGPVITLPGNHRITTRVGAVGTIIRETRRQKRGFQITFWCPDPASRDAIVPPVDAALADLDFLALPDGSVGRLIYERTRVSDRVEREGLYRRDLFYSVEYPTTDTGIAAEIVSTTLYLTDPNGIPIASPGDLILTEDGQAVLDGTGQRVRAERIRLVGEGGEDILAEDGTRILAEDNEGINVD
jgi:hypothetical protein